MVRSAIPYIPNLSAICSQFSSQDSRLSTNDSRLTTLLTKDNHVTCDKHVSQLKSYYYRQLHPRNARYDRKSNSKHEAVEICRFPARIFSPSDKISDTFCQNQIFGNRKKVPRFLRVLIQFAAQSRTALCDQSDEVTIVASDTPV